MEDLASVVDHDVLVVAVFELQNVLLDRETGEAQRKLLDALLGVLPALVVGF